jgi:hypothetical protein
MEGSTAVRKFFGGLEGNDPEVDRFFFASDPLLPNTGKETL